MSLGRFCFSEARGEELSIRHMGFCRNREAEWASGGVGLGERFQEPVLLGAEISPLCRGWHCLPNLN